MSKHGGKDALVCVSKPKKVDDFKDARASTKERALAWESAKAKGLKLLDAIGDGATAYIVLTAQRINNVPDEDLDELIFKFAKLLGKI